VVASDGLWDVCEDQQAIELTKDSQNSKEIAKTLLTYALANGTRDNTSVLVLKF
jgi:serine/threonine protein phosphatase PrpC